MTRPCVYFARPGNRVAVFFCSAESVARAVSIAVNLHSCFDVLAWVADWRVLAHEPSPMERAMIEAGG